MSAGRITQRRESRSGSKFSAPTPLVLVEQEPLRARVAADCADAIRRLNRARASWHHFERKDKPAFIRWRAREFGALLSRAREVEVQIRDFQTLIHEVELEMRRGFQDAYSAYERVMSRRASPSSANDGDTASASRTSPNSPQRLSEFEKEALFQEWVKRSLGTHPDKMDDEAYSTSFEAFKLHMFRHAPEDFPPAHKPAENNRNPPELAEPEEEEPSKVDSRVKELYRRLVRRLHPD